MVAVAPDTKISSTPAGPSSTGPTIVFAPDGSAQQVGIKGKSVSGTEIGAALDIYIERNPAFRALLDSTLEARGVDPKGPEAGKARRDLALRALCEAKALTLATLVDAAKQPILKEGKAVIVFANDTLPSQDVALSALGQVKDKPAALEVSDTFDVKDTAPSLPPPIKQSVALPKPKALSGKDVEGDARKAWSALTHSAGEFVRTTKGYATQEARAALYYEMLRDASPDDLRLLEARAIEIKDPQQQKAIDYAVRVRRAQLPGGALYGVDSPAAVEKYRAFVGPKCDAWLHKLGISQEDVIAWLTAPPGAALPPPIAQAVNDVQSGKITQENVNFLVYGLPLFAEVSRARAQGADAAGFAAQIEWADTLAKKVPGLAIDNQKQFASKLESEAASHDKRAGELEKQAATATPDKASVLRKQANDQKTIATRQRAVAVETRALLALMYQRGIEANGGPVKAPAWLRKQHTDMADGVARIAMVDGKNEADAIIGGEKNAKASGYDTGGYKIATAKLPKGLSDAPPTGVPGEKGYDAGGAGYWIASAEKLDPDAGKDPGHVAVKDGFLETKKGVARSYLEIRGYPPSGVGPYDEPGGAEQKANTELRGEVVLAIAAQNKTLAVRAEVLKAKAPRSKSETEELIYITGRLQTTTLELDTEKKAIAASQSHASELRKLKTDADSAVKSAGDGVAAIEGKIQESKERVENGPNDADKANARLVLAEQQAQLALARAAYNKAQAYSEKVSADQLKAGEPARSDNIQFTESGVAMKLRKAFPGQVALNDVGPPTSVILKPAIDATDYVAMSVLPTGAAVDKLPTKTKEAVRVGTIALGNADFYAKAAKTSRGEADDPAAESIALADKAHGSIVYADAMHARMPPASADGQAFAPGLVRTLASVAIDISTVLPGKAVELVKVAGNACDSVDPKNKDKAALEVTVATGASEVTFGAFRALPSIEPGAAPPARDYTLAAAALARARLSKLPKTDEVKAALKQIEDIENFHLALLGLVRKRKDVAKSSNEVTKNEVRLYDGIEVEALEKTQSFVVDLPILSTSILGWGAIFSSDIREAMIEHNATSFADLRAKVEAAQLAGKLSHVDQNLVEQMDTLELVERLLTKAGEKGRGIEVFKYIAARRYEDLQRTATELGVTGPGGVKLDPYLHIFRTLGTDHTAFGQVFNHKGQWYAHAPGLDLASAQSELDKHKGTANDDQANTIQQNQVSAYAFAKEMLPYQIAVAGGELVLGVVVPGAALKAVGTVGRLAMTARTAIFITRVGVWLERARETSVAVRGVSSAVRFAAQSRAAWAAFEKSGRLASFAVKVVEGYAIFGVQKGATYLAQKAGVSQTSFGGKLLYFSIQGLGASAQNRIARMTQLGEQLALPGLQYLATSIVIPHVIFADPNDPKRNEKIAFWSHAIEYSVPILGALHGSFKEHGMLKQEHAMAAAERFNDSLKMNGHPGLNEAQTLKMGELIFSAAKAKDGASFNAELAKIDSWAKAQGVPEAAAAGLKTQAALAYAGTKHLGPRENWSDKAPTREQLATTYEKVLADVRAAEPTMPIENARMYAQQLVAGKVEAAKTTSKNPDALDASLQALNQSIAHDTAAQHTCDAVIAGGVKLNTVQQLGVHEDVIPSIFAHLGKEGATPAEGKGVLEAAKRKLIEKYGLNEADAAQVINQALFTSAAQVARGKAALVGEGTVAPEALRIAHEANLTLLGQDPVQAHKLAVAEYASEAAPTVLDDASSALVQGGQPALPLAKAPAAEAIVAESLRDYDATATSAGKAPNLADHALKLEAKLTPILGAEAAHAVAKTTVARLAAEQGVAAANGSGPGLPTSFVLKDGAAQKAQIEAHTAAMQEASAGTKPPMFSDIEIAEARKTAIEALVLDNARAKIKTPEDGTPKKLAAHVEAAAKEAQALFPEINPKQIVADVAVREASRYLLEKTGPDAFKKAPAQVDAAVQDIAVKDFGADPALVKEALSRRQAEADAASGKTSAKQVVTISDGEVVSANTAELDQTAKILGVDLTTALRFNERKAAATGDELAFLQLIEAKGVKNPKFARAAFECLEMGPAGTREKIEQWVKSDPLATQRVQTLAEALRPLAELPVALRERISGPVLEAISENTKKIPAAQLRELVERLTKLSDAEFAQWKADFAGKDAKAQHDAIIEPHTVATKPDLSKTAPLVDRKASTKQTVDEAVGQMPDSAHKAGALKDLGRLAKDATFQSLPPDIQKSIVHAIGLHSDPVIRDQLVKMATDEAIAALTPAEQAFIFATAQGNSWHISAHARLFFVSSMTSSKKAQPLADRVKDLRIAINEQSWLLDVMAPIADSTVTRAPYAPPKLMTQGSMTFEGGHITNGKQYEVEINGVKIQIVIADAAPGPGLHGATVEQVTEALAHMSAPELAFIKRVRINPNTNSHDPAWAKEYKIDGFHSAATAGADGVIDVYPWTFAISQRQLDTVLVHESGHIISQQKFGLRPTEPGWAPWRDAIAHDSAAATKYARKNAEEDFSETLSLYRQVKGTPQEAAVRALMPRRFAILDAMTARGVKEPVAAYLPDFEPVTTHYDYAMLGEAQLAYGGNDLAAHSWFGEFRQAREQLKAANAASPPDPTAVAAANQRLTEVHALKAIQPMEKRVQAAVLVNAFGLKVLPHFEAILATGFKGDMYAQRLVNAASAVRAAKDPAVRARFDDALLDAFFKASGDLSADDLRASSFTLLDMGTYEYTQWRASFDTKQTPALRLKAIYELSQVGTEETLPPAPPTSVKKAPAPVDLTPITDKTKQHVFEGDIQQDPMSSYYKKWDGGGAHTWGAVQRILARDKYNIQKAQEDPVTGARFLLIERVGTAKDGKPVSGVVKKGVYPKSLTDPEVNAAGAAALSEALSGTKGTVLEVPGTKKRADGSDADGFFEATVTVGNPAKTIRVQGWYVIGANGKPEISTHAPRFDKTWPTIDPSSY